MAGRDNKIILFVIFLMLGILLAVQFRSTLAANRQKSAAVLNAESLMEQINQQVKLSNDMKTEIDRHLRNREAYYKTIINMQNDTALEKEFDRVWLQAGFTDVKGPGIVITLDDAEARQDTDAWLLIIHDSDIREILNELKKSGAQAISVNDERITAMSEQVCAGPTILINRNRYTVPFVIKAIGDAEQMYDAILANERVAFMIEQKIKVDIKKMKEVVVPKFNGVDKLGKLISGMEVMKK